MASTAVTSPTAASSPWKVYTVESTGKKYWYNKETKEKSWKDPTAQVPAAAESPAPKSGATAAPQAATPIGKSAAKAVATPASQPWKQYEVNGKKYWYNKETKEKSWKDPTPKSEILVSSAAPMSGKDAPTKMSSPATKAKSTTPATETLVSSTAPKTSKEAPAQLSSPAAKSIEKTPATKTLVSSAAPLPSKAAPGKVSSPAAKGTATTPATVVSSAAPVLSKEAPGKSSSPAAKATATTPATETSGVSLPISSKDKAPAPKNKDATMSAAQYAPKATGPVAPRIPPLSGSSPAPESTRESGATAKGHGAPPDEHVTAHVKSKKTNWRGALDVGLKALDSALDKAKKDDNPKKSTGPHPPKAGGPVSGASHHDKPVHAATATSAGNTTHPALNISEHTVSPRGKDTQPKAAPKLTWKSPFKKNVASPPAAEQHDARSVGGSKSAGAATVPSAGPSAASTSSHPQAHRGLGSSYYDGSSLSGEGLAAGAVYSHQNSGTGGDVAAAGAGTVAGAVAGAAGYSAYDYYEQGADSAPPTPPNDEEEEREEEDPTSGPPSPPSEANEADAVSLPPDHDRAFDLNADDDSPPTPPSEPGQASSAPSSPPNEYDSSPPGPPADDDDKSFTFDGPPSPQAQSDLGDDAGPPSPAMSGDHSSDADDGGDGGYAGDAGDGGDGSDAGPPSPVPSASPPPPPARTGPGAASDDGGSDAGDGGDGSDAGPPSPARSASPPPTAAQPGPGAASDDDDSDAGDGGDGGDGSD